MVREDPVIVYLTCNRIDVAVRGRDGRLTARRVDVSLPGDGAGWIAALRGVREQVSSVVRDMDCAGRETVVLYDSPTQSTDIISSPVRSVSAARSAAELACQDSLGHAVSAGVISSVCLGHDSASHGHNTHVAVAADRNDVVEAVAELVVDAGLEVGSISPIDAALMMLLSKQVLHQHMPCRGLLYVGEQHSYFFVGGAGTLRFHRRLILGTEALTRALTRPIRSDHVGSEVTLSARQASDLLHTHGFPARTAEVLTNPRLVGSDIIPMLLPAFQRFMVELRQSLRFGLTEDERAQLSIEIVGPGAGLPGFSSVICDAIDSDRCERAGPDGFHPGLPGSPGSDMAFMGSMVRELASLTLLPSRLSRKRMLASFRRTLWTGAAVSVLVVGADAWRVEHLVRDANVRVNALAGEQRGREALHVTNNRLTEVLLGLQQAEKHIRAEMQGPPLAPLLRELSQLVEDPIQLVSLSVNSQGDVFRGVISGLVHANDQQSQDRMLESLVASMQASPLVSSVALKNVQSGEIDRQRAIRFDVSFEVVGYSVLDIPVDHISAMHDEEEAQ